MKKPAIVITIALMLLPSLLTAQEARPAPDRGPRPETGRPDTGRPGGRPPGTGGPQIQPPRPGRPEIQPPRPGRPEVRPPRPGDGHGRPPRPGGDHGVRPPYPGRPDPGRPNPGRPNPGRPVPPRPPGVGYPGNGHRPGYGRPPQHNFRPIRGDRYRYPRGYGYRRWSIGLLLPTVFLSSSYYYDRYDNFGLSRPPAGYRWVRYGPDLVLVDLRTRRIRDVIYGAFY